MIPQGEQSDGAATHERKDADVIGLLMIAGLLFLILGICFLTCWGMLRFFNRKEDAQQRQPRAPTAEGIAIFPQPRLLVHPGSEREKLRTTEQTKLDTYGWVDRSSGVAHIPIARAMQLIAERGLPEVGAGQTRLQLMQWHPQKDVQPNDSNRGPKPGATP